MSTPNEVTTGGEFPSQEQLKGLGDLTFLFLRAPNYQSAAVADLRRVLEPVVDTGHFIVMRQDGIPRAAITWALMDAQSEARFLAGEPITSQDWMSGTRLWLMDMVAPYKQGSSTKILRHWEAALRPNVEQYQFVRHGKEGEPIRHYTARRLPSGKFRWHRKPLITAE